MIKIRNEKDFENWFKKNYKKLGFSKIIRYNQQRFPDFVVMQGNKKVKIELEIKSSNFLLHKHPINKVDKVICIEKDADLNIPIILLNNFKLVSNLNKTPYSFEAQIYKLFEKEKILVTSEIAKELNINAATAQSALIELVLEGKVERIKKEGVTLWLKK